MTTKKVCDLFFVLFFLGLRQEGESEAYSGMLVFNREHEEAKKEREKREREWQAELEESMRLSDPTGHGKQEKKKRKVKKNKREKEQTQTFGAHKVFNQTFLTISFFFITSHTL